MQLGIPRGEVTKLLRSFAVVMTLGMVIIGLVALGAHQWRVEYSVLTREPQVVLNGAPYVGLLSNLGAVVWAVPMVVCALAATLLEGRSRLMFGAAGLLSLMLLADDLFLLHDSVFPLFGIRERVIQLVYFVLIAAILTAFRRQMGSAAMTLVVGSVGFWGVSALLDRSFNQSALNLDQLTEDGMKFIGILLWATAWTTLAYTELRAELTSPEEPPDGNFLESAAA